MTSRVSESRRGFTLVELLVVVGIVAVLIALIMPAVTFAASSWFRNNPAAETGWFASPKAYHLPGGGPLTAIPPSPSRAYGPGQTS